MTNAELLLHPVRLRIVQAFLGNRALTTAELAAELPDVPIGSLYRHVGMLVRARVLKVVATERVRGALEKTYRLRVTAAQLDPNDLARMDREDHFQAFLSFVAGLLGDFSRYLERGEIDLRRDGVGYRMAALWLSDDELREFLARLVSLVGSVAANGPAPGRQRRLVAGVVLPTDPPTG